MVNECIFLCSGNEFSLLHQALFDWKLEFMKRMSVYFIKQKLKRLKLKCFGLFGYNALQNFRTWFFKHLIKFADRGRCVVLKFQFPLFSPSHFSVSSRNTVPALMEVTVRSWLGTSAGCIPEWLAIDYSKWGSPAVKKIFWEQVCASWFSSVT